MQHGFEYARDRLRGAKARRPFPLRARFHQVRSPSFRVSFPALNRPFGISEEEYGDGRARFRWLGDRFTSWYRLVVKRLNVIIYDRWLAADAPYGYGLSDYTLGFGETNHTASLDNTPFDLGIYSWSVQEWRAGDPVSEFSPERAFMIFGCVSAPAKAVVGINNDFWPLSGGSATNSPRADLNFHVNGATWYRIYVSRAGTKVIDQWVQSSDWRTPSDLPPGDYDVWVRAWNSCGLGDWSDSTPFTVAPNH